MKPAGIFMSTLFLSLFGYGIYRLVTLPASSAQIMGLQTTASPTPTSTPKPTLVPEPTLEPTLAPEPTLESTRPVTPTKTPFVKAGKVQVIQAAYGPPFGFAPTAFTVKAGQPVRLEVKANEDGIGCMGSLMVPQLSNQVEYFEKGKTHVIEFTPPEPGVYDITCAMGIPHGTITAN